MVKLKPNQKIVSEDGKKTFVVDALIHTGSGQGDIYKVHSDKDIYALKLFHTGDRKQIHKQIEILKRRGRASSAFVHPLYTIKEGDSVGYVMEYINSDLYEDGYILFNGIDYDTGDGNVVRKEIPFNKKIAVLYNIAEAVKILYEADIALMDLKFDNIKINKNDFSVKILDTDTAVNGKSKPIVSGTIGFMPPLTMKGEERPNRNNDAYALAVMIYMSLFGGHPLRGRKYEEPCNMSIDTYTFAVNPIYVFNRKDASNRPLDSDKRIIERYKKYPSYFIDALHRTFADGLFEGDKRVEPREWQEILSKLYEDHFICKHCGEEQFFHSVSKYCNVCGTSINPPIKLVCEKANNKGIYLFNGLEIWSSDLWGDSSNYQVFRVVVTDFEKKYGLLYTAAEELELQLKNGQNIEFRRGDIIPIFMDAVIKTGKQILKFSGGQN